MRLLARMPIRLADMSAENGVKERKYSIVLYSDDKNVRESVIGALGHRVAADMAEHVIHQFATGPALRLFVDSKKPDSLTPIDLFILDGEAVPEGGIGMARQLKDEVFNCPPVMVITGRKEDAWLAAWSRAEANVLHPVDPFTLANTVADLLRTHTVAINTATA
jgi:response regulator RpfG family c-di-GMP phosphodiesterase|tara:strand:+ start:2125 stop:2616 length:492 start_codon:yes stop_codon:yes gene_type:complete